MWRNEHRGARCRPRPGSGKLPATLASGPFHLIFYPRAKQPRCLDLQADRTGPLPDPGLLAPSTLSGHPPGISGGCKGSPRSDVGAGITPTLSPRHQPVRPTSGKLRQESKEGGKDWVHPWKTQYHGGAPVSLWRVRKLRPREGKEQLQGHGVRGKQSECKPKVLGSQQGRSH